MSPLSNQNQPPLSTDNYAGTDTDSGTDTGMGTGMGIGTSVDSGAGTGASTGALQMIPLLFPS
jgi:hypothetical protein